MWSEASLKTTPDGALIIEVAIEPQSLHEKQLMEAAAMISRKQTVNLVAGKHGKFIQTYWCFWGAKGQ